MIPAERWPEWLEEQTEHLDAETTPEALAATEVEALIAQQAAYRQLGVVLRDAAKRVDAEVARKLPPPPPGGRAATTTTVVGSVEVKTKRGTPTYSGWQNDDLLRAVLDSRPKPDEHGEIPDETPLDKVRACYSLSGSNVRVAVLRDRGIEPDEYAQVAWAPKVEYRT